MAGYSQFVTDYINASYICNYKGDEKAWIASQGPKDNTLKDFWNMIWQEKVPVIVMLTKTFEFIKVMCVQYWPMTMDKPEIFEGQFRVTVTEEENYAHFKVYFNNLLLIITYSNCKNVNFC